jgi:hypothetical protein
MDMAFGVEKNIVRLYVSVYNALPMDIPQCTAQLRNPELNGLFGEGLPRNVET